MAGFVTIDKPDVGDPTEKSLVDAIIDDLGFLWATVAPLASTASVNGSFEIDSDSDGQPDEWTQTLYAGGSGAIDAAVAAHGRNAYKFVHPGGGGNGGGYLESTSYFEVSTQRPMLLQWQMKSSVAGIKNIVEVRFFDKDQSFLSTVTAYSSTANPTAWTVTARQVTVPASARYAKLRFTGGDSAVSTAGSTWFDDIVILQNDSRAPVGITTYTANGTFVCPDHVTRGRIREWGGGAGGGGGGAAAGPYGGGGGGSGAYAESAVSLVPGTSYAVVIGQGGAGGTAGNNGTAGTATSFGGSLVVANGGSAGVAATGLANGAGGAGGTVGANNVDFAGGNGGPGSGSGSASNEGQGGAGGNAPCGGSGGPASANGTSAGTNGKPPGGGGSGASGSATGGNGGDGRLIIEY